MQRVVSVVRMSASTRTRVGLFLWADKKKPHNARLLSDDQCVTPHCWGLQNGKGVDLRGRNAYKDYCLSRAVGVYFI